MPTCSTYAKSEVCSVCNCTNGRHFSTCITDRRKHSAIVGRTYTGSLIDKDDAPCEECLGWYQHALDCEFNIEEKIKRAPAWGLTVPKVEGHYTPIASQKSIICPICFAVNGHRVTCPQRSGKCTKCGKYDTIEHVCSPLPCEICAGHVTHVFPCTT